MSEFTREIKILNDVIDEVGLPIGVQKSIKHIPDRHALQVKLRDVGDRDKVFFVSIPALDLDYRAALKLEIELEIVRPWGRTL